MVVAVPAALAAVAKPVTGFVVTSKKDGAVLCKPQPTAQEAWDAFWCSGWWRFNRAVIDGASVRIDWSVREQHFALTKFG